MTGQVCSSLTRIIVTEKRHDDLVDALSAAFGAVKVGDPFDPDTRMGPLAMARQRDRVENLIERARAEGARLATGGSRPSHLNRGYFIEPTVFANVDNDSTIAREEVFGPVLSILPYADEAQAIEIANDTPYGLAAYVQSSDLDHARKVARQLRAGQVEINDPDWDTFAPFGGYKQSGNGREYADWGIHDFVETKALVGYGEA